MVGKNKFEGVTNRLLIRANQCAVLFGQSCPQKNETVADSFLRGRLPVITLQILKFCIMFATDIGACDLFMKFL